MASLVYLVARAGQVGPAANSDIDVAVAVGETR